MRRLLRRTGLALLPFAPLVPAACGSNAHQPVLVSLAPTLILPRALLDDAASLALTVYDGTTTGATCNTNTGIVQGVTATTAKVASQNLGTTGCAAGDKFCGSLPIAQSADALVFSAAASTSAGEVIAEGCATATVSQSTLQVDITMVRFVPAATCGNGVIEPTEQCDPPGGDGDSGIDLLCDSSCHTKEEVLFAGPKSTTLTQYPGPVALLWPAQSGTDGELFAFYTQQVNENPIIALQIGMRAMSDALLPVQSPAAAAGPILAPNGSGTFPPTFVAGDQLQPSAAFAAGTYWYAVNDDSRNNDPDITLRSFDDSLTSGVEHGVNGPDGAGEANQQVSPAVAAGSSGSVYVAWQDLNGPNSGQIVGRTYSSGAGLGSETVLSTGTGNENVNLVATSTGWIAVFDDEAQVKMRVIDNNGTPSGGEIVVSAASQGTQDHPGIAVLPDGRVAVVWCNHAGVAGADIYVQRYDANLNAVAGDQSTPINDVVTTGDQTEPAIAGSTAASGSFVAAWLDVASGQIRARVLDGTTGFDFNPIDGQDTEFQASIATGDTRENPTVAIGGAGPWVAIGWDDGSDVYARRFPTSTEQ